MRGRGRLFLLVAGILSILVAGVVNAEAATIYVPDDYSTIQAAVNAANPGDTIIVRDGTYVENVDVNKDYLTISSENGSEVTVVEGSNWNDYVFEVTADYVEISGFTVAWGYYAIYLCEAKHCNISNNNVPCYASAGICLSHSSNNTLANNTVSSNRQGIRLYYSSDNTLTNNTMSDNEYNLSIRGDEVSDFINNIDTSNKVNGKPVQYLIGQQDLTIDSSWDVGYLGLVNCTNITVKDLSMGSNGEGILLAYSSNSRIENINASSNDYGIYLSHSSNSTLANNTASSNKEGICLYSSSDNTLTNNMASTSSIVGIHVCYSSYNTLTDNTASSNRTGIFLHFSSENILINNTMLDNEYNLKFYGYTLSSFIHDIDSSNKVNGKPVQYLIGQQNLIIDASWDVGYLGLINCTNITVKDLSVTNNGQGVLLAYSTNSKIENVNVSGNDEGIGLYYSADNILANNTASDCRLGIWLGGSSDNTLIDNVVLSNGNGVDFSVSSHNILINTTLSSNQKGIRLDASSSNIIYLNNFIENGNNVVFSRASTNTWNSPEPIIYTYNGNTWTNCLGNYWDDYTGSDSDGDGIGDIPYILDSDEENQDNYPLMMPFENYATEPIHLWAVIIGVGNYTDPGIEDLDYSINDANEIYVRLINSGWIPDHIKLLTDSQATKANIEEAIDWMGAGAGINDLCLFFFSGYGTYSVNDLPPDVEADGHDEFICPVDTQVGSPESAIRDDEFAIWMDPILAQKVIILDACRSGGFVNDFQKPGYVILAASEEDANAAAWPELEHGVFTYYILQGLNGPADSNKDGKISAEELFSYAGPRVVEFMAEQGYHQQPQLYDGIDGEVIIVKLEIIILGKSPIDLVVTDPDGFTITKESGEVPGMYYMEYVVNGDGELNDIVAIPRRKIGDYLIQVVPEPNALPDDTYSLEVTIDGQTMVLAEDVPIPNIPAEPYEFESKLNRCDFDSDGDVDFADYAIFANHWSEEDCNYPNWCEGTDLDYKGLIDFIDLDIFVDNWLWEKMPADFDIDGDVDFADYVVFADHWMDDNCDAGNDYCEGTDLDELGTVDIIDLGIFADNWLAGV